MTDYSELVKALRYCGNFTEREGCAESCEYFNDMDCPNRIMSDAADAIEALQAEMLKQGEIVRCRECKYSTLTYQGEMKYCKKLARKDEYGDFDPTFYVSGDWFCADGEREVHE